MADAIISRRGVDVSGVTATATDILAGKKIITPSGEVTGTIPSKGAETITPGTTNKTIAAGQYLSEAQTIAGDADLIAANIAVGVNIFGVTGTARRSVSGKVTCGGSRYNTITTNFQPSKVVYYSNPLMKDPFGKTYFAVISWDAVDPGNVHSMVYGFLNSDGWWSNTSTGAYGFRQGVEALSSGSTWVGPTSVCLPNMWEYGLIGFMNSAYPDYYMYYTIVE